MSARPGRPSRRGGGTRAGGPALAACLALSAGLAQPPPLPTPTAAAPAPAAERIVEVAISSYAYHPAEVTIEAGTTVRWTNHEKRASHSILFTGEAGFESERLFPGESWQRRFEKPGTYLYTCGPHPEMRGRIEVTE